jgi:type II secretory pathway component HofQ
MRRFIVEAMLLAALFAAGVSAAAPSAPGPLARMAEKKISIHGRDFPLATLLVALGREAGVNVFVSDKVSGKTSLDLDDVPLDRVFALVTEAKGLRYRVEDGIIVVEREDDFRKSGRDIASKRLCTRYSRAAGHIDEIKTVLSPAGTVAASTRGNCVVVRDRAENLALAERMLAELDLPVPQVHIKARIVTVSREARKRLGIRWDYDNLRTDNNLAATVDLGVDHSSNFSIGFLRSSLDLGIDLQALQQQNKLHILSSPEVLVLDGRTAEIKQGKEVPYTTQTTDNVQNTSFREANLSLKVTPRVMEGGRIQMDLAVTNDSVDQNSQVGNEPLINKQAITTSLILKDGVTVVIGGILLDSRDHQRGGVPVLSKIPLLGGLFRSTEKVDERSELLVFLTPRIVDLSAPVAAAGDESGEGRGEKSGGKAS